MRDDELSESWENPSIFLGGGRPAGRGLIFLNEVSKVKYAKT